MVLRRHVHAGVIATASLVAATMLAFGAMLLAIRLSGAGSSGDLGEGLALGALVIAVLLLLTPVLALGCGWVAARSTGVGTWRRSWRLGLGAWVGLFVPLVVSAVANFRGGGTGPVGLAVVVVLVLGAGVVCATQGDRWATGAWAAGSRLPQGGLAGVTVVLVALVLPVAAWAGLDSRQSDQREAEEEAGLLEILGDLDFQVFVPTALPEGYALDEAFAAVHPPMGGPSWVTLSFRAAAPGAGWLELDQTKLGIEPVVTEPGVCEVSFYGRAPLAMACMEVTTASGIRLLGLVDEDPNADLSVVSLDGTLVLLRSRLLTVEQLLEVVDGLVATDPATIEGIGAI